GAERQWAEGVFAETVMRRLARGRLAGVVNTETPFSIEAAPVGGPGRAGFNSYTHSFSGMTLQYLLFWGMESGLLFLRERRQGIWARVRRAPWPVWVVLTGKAVATAGIALLIVLATFGFGYVAFGVRV